MIRKLLVAAFAVAVLAVPAAAGKRVARPFSPVEKVARAEIVITGKVTAVAKETPELIQFPGDPMKVAHKVVTIKVEKGLLGADKLTEVKVAFLAPPKADPNVPRPRGNFQQIDLNEGQEGVFFLTKHASGEYHTFYWMLSPIDAKDPEYKAQLDVVTKAAAAITNPAKALKAEKAEDRFLAATAILTKYRTAPDGVETEVVKVPADESRAVLKALAEGDWSKYDGYTMNGTQAFYSLGLTEKDGWVAPMIVNAPGAPPVDPNAATRSAFADWLDGAGKKYQINRIVPKAKK